jgi:polyisoprenoid-binding protein YceI
MKIFNLLSVFVIFNINVHAQTKLLCRETKITFFSKATLENISAQNNKALSAWDVTNGVLEFSVLIKGFEFQKQLMQEHFNENYMESDKYPKATFKGSIENYQTIILTKDNTYKINATGTLTMHGVSKQITVPASITIKNGVVSSQANFTILLADYNIKIPGVVAKNISNQITISVTVPAYKSS